MQVKWLRRTLRNLEHAHAYIANDDLASAIRVILKIQVGVNQLAQFPSMGRERRVDGTRELVIANTPYVVIYRRTEESVIILRVLHNSRRYPD